MLGFTTAWPMTCDLEALSPNSRVAMVHHSEVINNERTHTKCQIFIAVRGNEETDPGLDFKIGHSFTERIDTVFSVTSLMSLHQVTSSKP